MRIILSRTLDELHRFVLPLVFREALDIEENTTIYMETIKDKIIISKNTISNKNNLVYELKINSLGMVMIPYEIAVKLNLSYKSRLCMFLEGSVIILFNGNFTLKENKIDLTNDFIRIMNLIDNDIFIENITDKFITLEKNNKCDNNIYFKNESIYLSDNLINNSFLNKEKDFTLIFENELLTIKRLT